MNKTIPPSPSNKKEYIAAIGKILVEENGKKKYYSPQEVKKAHNQSAWFEMADLSSWAMVTFSEHSEFDRYHEASGEAYDYIGMKTEMLNGLSASPDINWSEIPDLDIDASWLDFGDVFEGLLEGIGEVIGGIFDGL